MWTHTQVEQATRGKASGAWSARRIAIDSRSVQPGDLFVALKGERFDGHDYVEEAIRKGAVAALVSKVPAQANTPCVLVEDTTRALVDLAVFNRARTKARIIGVTGSVGKTSTKEALKLAFSAHGNTYATVGNLNNHIGLPLCLANLTADTQYAVFELGMNHAGEISYLTRLVRPDIAMITTVEAVHLEFFDSVEGIADAKSEIMEGLPAGGTIILNRDNRYFERCLGHAKRLNVKNTLSFASQSDGADFNLMQYETTPSGSMITVRTPQGMLPVALGVIGKHWAMNILATLAAVHAAGLDLKPSTAALRAFSEPEGRGKFYPLPVPTGMGEYTLIDDCYNASPSSMVAAFAKMQELSKSRSTTHRTIAVLGDMLELGIRAPEFHAELASEAKAYGVDLVYACGPLMKHLYDALKPAQRGGYAADSQSLWPLVERAIRAEDIVLIKGSNGSRMKYIREALQAVATSSKEKTHAV